MAEITADFRKTRNKFEPLSFEFVAKTWSPSSGNSVASVTR